MFLEIRLGLLVAVLGRRRLYADSASSYLKNTTLWSLGVDWVSNREHKELAWTADACSIDVWEGLRLEHLAANH